MGFLSRQLTDEQRAEELFSPYLDGQVTAEERAFLERYLAAHPEAREKFELLKAAVQLTRSLPPVKAPRSFVLPRSMARRPSFAVRMYPVMRLATVAAMALFVFAFVGDLATQSRLASVAQPAESVMLRAAVSTPVAAEQMIPVTATAEVAPTAAPEAAAAAPAPAPTMTAIAPAGTAASKTAEATATPEAMMMDAAAPTQSTTPTADGAQADAAQPDQAASYAAPAAPPTPQIDLVRGAWIALAGLAVTLTAATLIIRRRF